MIKNLVNLISILLTVIICYSVIIFFSSTMNSNVTQLETKIMEISKWFIAKIW